MSNTPEAPQELVGCINAAEPVLGFKSHIAAPTEKPGVVKMTRAEFQLKIAAKRGHSYLKDYLNDLNAATLLFRELPDRLLSETTVEWRDQKKLRKYVPYSPGKEAEGICRAWWHCKLDQYVELINE